MRFYSFSIRCIPSIVALSALAAHGPAAAQNSVPAPAVRNGLEQPVVAASPTGEVALSNAIALSDQARVAALLDANPALVNNALPGGSTALLEAIRWHDAELVELLLAHGARADGANAVRRTPLQFAIETRQPGMVAALLAAGARADAVVPAGVPGAFGNDDRRRENTTAEEATLLEKAMETGSTELIIQLMDAGADLSIKRHSRGYGGP